MYPRRRAAPRPASRSPVATSRTSRRPREPCRPRATGRLASADERSHGLSRAARAPARRARPRGRTAGSRRRGRMARPGARERSAGELDVRDRSLGVLAGERERAGRDVGRGDGASGRSWLARARSRRCRSRRRGRAARRPLEQREARSTTISVSGRGTSARASAAGQPAGIPSRRGRTRAVLAARRATSARAASSSCRLERPVEIHVQLDTLSARAPLRGAARRRALASPSLLPRGAPSRAPKVTPPFPP